MKQLKRSFALLLVLLLALAVPVMAEDDFNAQLTFGFTEAGEPTVSVEDSPVLAQRKPTLTVSCSFDKAYVTFADDGASVPSTLDPETQKITFTVERGGLYVIHAGEDPTPPAPPAPPTQEKPDPVTPVGPSPAQPSLPQEPSAQPETPSLPFRDVTKDAWYAEAVSLAYEKGLMSGVSSEAFGPDHDTTRGMIVTILARLDGIDTSSGQTWFETGRTWAMDNGISDGTNMNGNITREQLALMLFRYAMSKGWAVSARARLDAYADGSSVSSWAADAMSWAVASGLIQGRDGNTLAPLGKASRAETAAILTRFLHAFSL